MIKEALIKKLEGDIAMAKADLQTFFVEPIGVAEHIDYVITAEKKLDALSSLLSKPINLEGKLLNGASIINKEVEEGFLADFKAKSLGKKA